MSNWGYKLKSLDNKTYLGILGETGVLVEYNKNGTLVVNCRSAMNPNIYNIAFNEIEPCVDRLACDEGTCLQEKGKLNWEYGYRIIYEKISFLLVSEWGLNSCTFSAVL